MSPEFISHTELDTLHIDNEMKIRGEENPFNPNVLGKGHAMWVVGFQISCSTDLSES